VHHSSGKSEFEHQPRVSRAARRTFTALVCAAIFAAGCGNNNLNSGYGVAWVTLTDDPGDFTSYIVNVDSITLFRNDGAEVTALATPETVDFTKLNNVAELWGTATIPTGTYVSANITLDYTYAVVSVMVNGVPQRATVVNPAGAAVTTVTINVILDPANPLYIAPTYATTAAQRLALDFNLAASTTSINTSTSPVTVTINPYFTAGIAPPDNKLIRVRGPLINSSVDLLTYTVYVRPFFDEVNSLGSLTLFADANTIYTINGKVVTGSAGLNQLSQSSAGSTVTAGYASYQPTPTPSATAADWLVKYVVAGSTLEDVYTQGLEGDVVARSGNTLTVRGATLQLNDGTSTYCGIPTASSVASVACSPDATVLLGPSTTVTADDDATLTNLNSNSIAVGQHIIVRGILPGNSLPAAGAVTTIDATGTSSNTGSVRLIQTSLWGSIVSSSAGNLLLNLSTINNWPISDFTFAGNGTSAAANPTGANFLVNTGAIVLPDTTVGDPSWVDGLVAPFGSAPPAFTASTVNDESSVQMVGNATPAAGATCGQAVTANLHCMPASMRVVWPSPGTTTPFLGLGGTTTINLAGASSAIIRIGAESVDMTTLPATPTFVSTVAPPPTPATSPNTGSVPQTLPPVFLPEYSFALPTAVSFVAAAPTFTSPGINVFSSFSTFSSGLTTALATTPALQFEARGTYDRASNTFTAISANVLL
jgi:hypothetical protein